MSQTADRVSSGVASRDSPASDGPPRGGIFAAMCARLGEQLVADGRLRPQELEKALETQTLVGGRLGTNLLELGLVEERSILEALGRLRSTRTVSASELRAVKPEVARLVPPKLAGRYRLVPYAVKGKTLFVASKDPGDPLQEDEISFLTSYMVRTCIALELRVEIALRRLYRIQVERRYLVLGKRLARGGPKRPKRPKPKTPPSPSSPSSPSSRPARPEPGETPTAPQVSSSKPSTPSTSSPSAPPAPPAPSAPSASASPAGPTEIERDSPEPPPRKDPGFIELDADELASLRRPASPDEEREWPPVAELADEDTEVREAEEWIIESAEVVEDTSPEGRLVRATLAFQNAEIRDEIGEALLDFAAEYFARRALFIARRGRIFGWMASGEGVDEAAIRAVDLDAQKPSVFFGLDDAESFWLGPLPPLPSNRALTRALAGVDPHGEGEEDGASDAEAEAPKSCVVLPVTLRGKVVCHLYGDNRDEGVAGAPVAELKRLVAKAGLAFEVYILKNKIRLR